MNNLVIRTLHNNKNWSGPCCKPFSDELCYYCQNNKSNLAIKPPNITDTVCSGSCWEQTLCTQYFWGCTPYGNLWGKRAKPGMKVLFVFRQKINSKTLYTLWAETYLKSIDSGLNSSGIPGKNGYNLMYFEPFQPFPKNQWKRNLLAQSIVGNDWGSGNYRYT